MRTLVRGVPPLERCALLMLCAPVLACYPRGLQTPMPYTVRANGDLESLLCARERFIGLGFQFYGDRNEDRVVVGSRTLRRPANRPSSGVRDIAYEVVRLELKEEGRQEAFEVTIGVSRRPDPTAPDFDGPIDLWLEAPSRSSIIEADEIARDCQRPPFGGS